MATFSFGTAPGAPGTYINESVGNVASAGIATFNTVYMLVETENSVSVVDFPFNKPVAVTSLTDYKSLVGGVVPTAKIPLLSFNCVNSFFQNAQIGDLRVVRVGTPNQISEIEILPSGLKLSNSGLPSNLEAGDTVYVQLILNGLRLVAGDGSTGYTSSGEWLGVPVTIPADYIDGDPVNNRKIAKAITTAIAEAVESNPSVRSSIYVRDYGLVVDTDPTSGSESGYIHLAAATYDGSVSVVTQQNVVGSISVLMNNAYDVINAVGMGNDLVRVYQDYIQCINTAFDGQINQGYLIAPTAYAQFDAAGRSAVGAAAAAHCQDNNFKWMALADPGPFLVTDINKYSDYVPHSPAADLVTGLKYLVDNAIYEWTGTDVTYDKLRYQPIVSGYNPEVAVKQSREEVADGEKVGALDPAVFTIESVPGLAGIGKFVITSSSVWPAGLHTVKVTVSNAGDDLVFLPSVDTLFVVAPPLNTGKYGPYPSNGTQQIVYLADSANAASGIYNEVLDNGGTENTEVLPNGAISADGTGGTADLSYETPAWDLQSQITINGQSSNLIKNITGSSKFVNTVHLPGTLQDSTKNFRLNFVSRAILNPGNSAYVEPYTSGSKTFYKFICVNHGLKDGQKVFFTQPILQGTTTVFKATNVNGENPYFVKSVDNGGALLLASSYSNYLAGSFVESVGTLASKPTILYSSITAGDVNSVNMAELSTVALMRGRKYGLASGSIFNEAGLASNNGGSDIGVSLYLNNSSIVLSKEQIFPYGETEDAEWLPKLELVNLGSTPIAEVQNFICTPTVDQRFNTEAYIVPSLDPIYGGDYDADSPDDAVATVTAYTTAVGLTALDSKANLQAKVQYLDSVYFQVTSSGTTPDSVSSVAAGDIMIVKFDGSDYNWVVVSPGAEGVLDTLDNLLGGTLYTDGSYTNVPLLSNSGADFKGATANITVSGGEVTAVALTSSKGSNYTVGETLTADNAFLGGTGSGFSIDVDAVTTTDGDTSALAHVCYGSQVELSLTAEQTPPSNLWRFDAITSTEIIDEALRGVGFSGVPQAEFIEAGVDNVNRLFEDSQRYFNAFGFIAYYGPYVLNASGQYIPPSPYVTGVALRRYRAEGFQFPPAGVKYQLADAVASQIAINSAQQNLLNPDGCNAVRTLPGYPDTAVYIWGGRTRINKAVADQRKFQFVNTRVIQNVVYGSLRNAFDNQIFSVIDGFGVIFNQIVSIGNSVLSQLWIAGALYGARPSDAFQVICDNRINTSENLENGLIYVKVFDVPVPTLERIEVDLIRVSIGQMNRELQTQGLG